jgi:hypothetical protein
MLVIRCKNISDVEEGMADIRCNVDVPRIPKRE